MLCSSTHSVQHITAYVFDCCLAPLFLSLSFFPAVLGGTIGDKHAAVFVIVRILFFVWHQKFRFVFLVKTLALGRKTPQQKQALVGVQRVGS